jgi:hypothetical protein
MTARCRHRNGTYVEFHRLEYVWDVRDGVLGSEATFSTGDMLDDLEFRCDDCGRRFRFARGRVPAWMRRYDEQIGTDDER